MCIRSEALLAESFAYHTCLPPPGVARGPRWLGNLAVGTLLAATGVATNRLAAAELSIPTVGASVGGSVNLSVEYGGQGTAVAALQFDLNYNRSVLTITAAAGAAATSAGKSLTTHRLPNGMTRFLIVGLNQNVVADGSAVDLMIHVSTRASPGKYTLGIFNPAGAGPSSQAVSVKHISGAVVVHARKGG